MTGFGWFTIARLGLVQAAIGAMVMISTSLLNRIMMVELGLAAAVPAGLVAWHYAVQLSRPVWGHGSDRGRRRTPWIVGGMGVLALGTILAVDAAIVIGASPVSGGIMVVIAYTLIGAGVGAAGTSLLALLASGVAPERRAAAAAVTWIMMVAGIAISAGVVGALIEPFSFPRLALMAGAAVLAAFLLTLAALFRLEGRAAPSAPGPSASFPEAMRAIATDPAAMRFTAFVFVSMLAYSMQDLILEPFGGLVFALSPGATTQLSGAHHGGVLAGMILAGVGASAFSGRRSIDLDRWIAAGCLVSAAALGALIVGAGDAAGWPLLLNLVALGVGNGVFAAAAIGAMMGLAGAGDGRQSGARMGVWGAAQAVAFGLGGLLGAVIVDVLRSVLRADIPAFQAAFALEALLFLGSALLALHVVRRPFTAAAAVPA